MSLQEVINTLRSVAQSTDKESAYKANDTIEGNLTHKTGSILPDRMEEDFTS